MMLVCRPRPHRLVGISFLKSCSVRSTSTSSSVASSSSPQPVDKSQDSIFTTPESPWEHVFSDVEPVSSPAAVRRLRTRLGNKAAAPSLSLSRHKTGLGQHQGLLQRSSSVKRQRASLTAREMSVFDEMFDMIFNAVSAQDGKKGSSRSTAASSAAARASSEPEAASLSGETPSIGRAGAPLGDLFRTLRRHSRVRWTTAIDEELDRKKETMELFNTDYDLLQWVTHELFGEAQQWEEEAKRAVAASHTKTKDEGKGKDTAAATTVTASAASASPSESPREVSSKRSIYPHLIAHAMRIFRTTYSNPSLSLAVFNHAARMSIPSYVFGCTAPAYNELIEAKWEGWGDLEGVCSALEEMRANGVKLDGRTRIVVEMVRREVGEARPLDSTGEDGQVDLAGVNPLARRIWRELGETEVMRLVHRIERLALRDRSRKSTSSPHAEPWKNEVLQPAKDDGWSFDGWDKEKSGDTKKRTRRATPSSEDKRMLDGLSLLDTAEEEMAFR